MRAFCILTGADYRATYREMRKIQRAEKPTQSGISRGVFDGIWKPFFAGAGIVRVKIAGLKRPTFTEAHERYGDCIVSTRRHIAAIVDGALPTLGTAGLIPGTR